MKASRIKEGIKLRFYGQGVVWDKEKKRRLCKFEGGVFDTDDKRTIDLLTEMGYEADLDHFATVEEIEEEMTDALEALTIVKLKEIAKEKGVPGYSNMNKATLIECLK